MAEHNNKNSGSDHTIPILIVVLVTVGVIGLFILPFIHFGAGGVSISFAGRDGSLFGIWRDVLGPIFMVIDAGLLAAFVFIAIRMWPYRTKISLFEVATVERRERARHQKDPRLIQHWVEIVERAKSGTPENMRLSIIEADALVDFFLKRHGYEGEHMADRLSQIIEDDVKSIERVWKAHRLRNDLAHTPGLTVTPKQASETLTAYRDFLVELGAL